MCICHKNAGGSYTVYSNRINPLCEEITGQEKGGFGKLSGYLSSSSFALILALISVSVSSILEACKIYLRARSLSLRAA